MHCAEPSAAAYWPGVHGEQADCPVALEKVPKVQSVAEAAPVELTKEPSGAEVQAVAATWGDRSRETRRIA